MSLSSSTSDPPPGLFDEVLARGGVRAAVSDQRWLAGMLRAEAALAHAQATLGLIPPGAAETIRDRCQPERFPLNELARAAGRHGNPVIPLVAALRAQVGPAAAEFVHHGATSQDILDTAAMLICADALRVLSADLTAAADATAALAQRYRDTPMAGRTLLQQAMPTTFGLKAAGWLAALDTAREGLTRVTGRLAVQLGGATGTLAGYGSAGPAVLTTYAAGLGLAAPTLPWHTDRTRIAELAGALATAAGASAKPARDVTLLAQSEVAEVSEHQPGGSSAMPHKRNPVAALSTLAAAAQAPGLAATLYAAMVHEHERAAGAWHAEWRPLRELLIATGSAAAWLRECLSGLQVDESALATHLAQLATAADLTDPARQLGAAAALVDQLLATREVAREH